MQLLYYLFFPCVETLRLSHRSPPFYAQALDETLYAGAEESIVWRIAEELVQAYLGASIPCFSHPGLVQAVLLLSSVLFLLLSPLPLTARQWTAPTRLSPMRTRRQWTRSTRSMAHSDELLASTPEENSRNHANMSARSFWERTLVRRTRDVLEFGTTQPYRLI